MSTFPYSYIRKKIVKTKDAVIPVQSKAVQYGIGFFTGIRGNYDSKEKNLYLFRFEDHYKRLQESAKILGMKFNYSFPEFKKIIIELIKKNNIKENFYVRPTVYAGSTKLTPRFNDNEDDDLAIYIISLKDYYTSEKALSVCVSSWRRMNDDALSVKAKNTGAYASSALAKTEALENGYDEVIFLDRDGKVCETSSSNIFGVKEDEIWTPPLANSILTGITRKTVIELIEKELKLKVREENFDRSMLYTFEELFLTGTAAKITPIGAVDKRKVGNGKLGATTKKLQELLNLATVKKLPGYEKWCTPVY